MMKKLALTGTAVAAVATMVAPAAAQFQRALDETRGAVQEGAASQQRVDALDDQTAELRGEYVAKLKQVDVLRRFNDSRAREVENQQREIAGLRQDVENLEGLQRATLPLLEEMLETLETFVAADTPFLLEERRERLERLNNVMADSSQTAASRYNLIMEAYQIENEYGRTIDSYKGVVTNENGEELTVDFLRLGRLALIYKNADNTVLRIWDNDQKQFVDLDRSFLGDVTRAIRVANEQLPPDLLVVPVTSPVRAAGVQ